jgi:hypothetical protein
MENENIIKGYCGIMDLDIRNIDPKFKKDVIIQHYEDIKNYKKEQSELHPRLRYENTILRIKNMHEFDAINTKKRNEKHDIEQLMHNKIYNEAKRK